MRTYSNRKMYEISFSKRSRKALRKLRGSGRFDEQAVRTVLNTLANGEPLPGKCDNHPLQGECADCFECHIKSDLLLIYKIDTCTKTVAVINMGSHSELFR